MNILTIFLSLIGLLAVGVFLLIFMDWALCKIIDMVSTPTLSKPRVCQTSIGNVPCRVIFRPATKKFYNYNCPIKDTFVVQLVDATNNKLLFEYLEKGYSRANRRYNRFIKEINKCSPWIIDLVVGEKDA